MAWMGDARTGRPARLRPLVAPSAVRSWARHAGIEVGGIFDVLDDQVVDQYLAHLASTERAERVIDLERASAAGTEVPGAAGDPGDIPSPDGTLVLSEVGGRAVVGPAPCPQCAGHGYLDFVDLAAGRQWQRCRACGVSWSTEIALATLEHASR